MSAVREALEAIKADLKRPLEYRQDLGDFEKAIRSALWRTEQALSALTQPHPEAVEHWPRIQDTPEWKAAQEEPHPEAREDAYEIGTPREFAERLAWMAVNGKPDLDQWENHIKFRDAALSRLAAKEGNGRSQQARIENLRESLVIADARMTKQLSGKLMSVTLIGYLSQIQQDIRAAIKADNEAAASATPEKPEEEKL